MKWGRGWGGGIERGKKNSETWTKSVIAGGGRWGEVEEGVKGINGDETKEIELKKRNEDFWSRLLTFSQNCIKITTEL